MTRVKVTFIAMNADGNVPITTADSFDNLRKALDAYYAVDRGEAECLGFYPYHSKYPDDYEGYYEYKYHMIFRDKVEVNLDKVKVYCVEYYPHTVYEVNE